MSMGKRDAKQETIWIPHTEIAKAPAHRFYEKLNEILEDARFDERIEGICSPYFEPPGTPGRPSTPPGVYFRMLLIGYFEGLRAEREICWRCADSLSLRRFLGLRLTDEVPDNSTLSRLRDRFDEVVYVAVFDIALGAVAKAGLLRGKVLGVDSTYLQADASMRSIVRREDRLSYQEYLKELARSDGQSEPTAEDCRRLDRDRPGKKVSNREWESKTDGDARIVKMKDGRTRLGYKSEHVVDLDSGAIVGVEIYPGDASDSATLVESVVEAIDNVEAAVCEEGSTESSDPAEAETTSERSITIVADKGYHKSAVLLELHDRGLRSFIPERRSAHPRRWKDKERGEEMAREHHLNRARTKRPKGRRYQRLRGELLERPNAHICETGGGRRLRVRGLSKVWKSHLLRVVAFNLGLLMRHMYGYGTPRGLAGAFSSACRLPEQMTLGIRGFLPVQVRRIRSLLAGSTWWTVEWQVTT